MAEHRCHWQPKKGDEAGEKLFSVRVYVDVNSKDPEYGRTQLSRAAERGREVVVKLLLARDDVDADSKESDGRTPLSWAAENGHEAVVKLFLPRDDVDADSEGSNGRKPLSWAAEIGHEAVVKRGMTSIQIPRTRMADRHCHGQQK